MLELKGRFVASTTNAPASQNHARRTEAVSVVTFRVRLEGARNPHELVCALTLLPFGPCAAFFLTAPKVLERLAGFTQRRFWHFSYSNPERRYRESVGAGIGRPPDLNEVK